MESLGATIVDIDTGDVFAYTGDEFTALLFEFKAQIAEYLSTLTHTKMRTLADLIAFDDAHCAQEMRLLRSGSLRNRRGDERRSTDPVYVAARTNARTRRAPESTARSLGRLTRSSLHT